MITSMHPQWQEPEGMNQYYPGRIILLIDRFVGSAAEDFILLFKDNSRAIIVGECTWGSTGQPVIRQFGEDIRMAIGAIRAYFPNGDPFEGIGIMPDVEVPNIRDDFYTSRDAILLKALELLDY
jgi:carboxyl-terminal processing protease